MDLTTTPNTSVDAIMTRVIAYGNEAATDGPLTPRADELLSDIRRRFNIALAERDRLRSALNRMADAADEAGVALAAAGAPSAADFARAVARGARETLAVGEG